MALLTVKNLSVGYHTRKGFLKSVQGVSFALDQGKSLGLVGESGCGKTSVAFTLLRLLPDNAEIKTGKVYLNDTELIGLSEEEMRKFRWRHISMDFPV